MGKPPSRGTTVFASLLLLARTSDNTIAYPEARMWFLLGMLHSILRNYLINIPDHKELHLSYWVLGRPRVI